jgi:hypothetical protein
MADPQQSYANHRQFYPLFHFVVFPILFINLLVQLWVLYRHPNRWSVWNVIVAFAFVAFSWTARTMVLRVQDRLIILEERMRLGRLLPEDLRSRVGELKNGQLIATRFCDDAEVPELCRAILNGEVKGREEIKRRIKTWRPDYMRA